MEYVASWTTALLKLCRSLGLPEPVDRKAFFTADSAREARQMATAYMAQFAPIQFHPRYLCVEALDEQGS